MKRFLLAICMSMALVMMVAPAYAMELWEPHLPGVDEGLAAGALPPAGLYFINNSYFATNFKAYDWDGHANASIKLPTYVDVPVLIWSTGCKFLGAAYAMGIAQPFDWTNLRVDNAFLGTLHESISGTQWGTYNTVLIPFALSWSLPYDLHVKGALAIYADDATTSVANSQLANGNHAATYGGLTKYLDKSGAAGTPQNAYAWSGLGEWVFEPNIGISWLHCGWNLSGDFFYNWSLKNSTASYQSGDLFQADYTLSYTWRKWTLGVGATQANQLQSDKFVDAFGHYGSQPGTKETLYRVGPLLGYNFGPCSVMLVTNFTAEAKNCASGTVVNLRFVVPLGTPCALWKK